MAQVQTTDTTLLNHPVPAVVPTLVDSPKWPDVVGRLGRRPTLDGLRGLAWIAVFVGHAELLPTPGIGSVSMYVFFGLSGFLITSIILDEWNEKGSVDLRRFFVRRALRLVPALVLFLLVWLGVVAVFGGSKWMTTVPGGGSGAPEPIGIALQGVIGALFYVTNWMTIFHLYSGYVPIGHLWSLAVEEQLYVVWAPVSALLLAFRRNALIWGIALVATASVVVALVLTRSGNSIGAYMGTGARAGAFMIGGALAFLRTSGALRFLDRRWRAAALSALAIVAMALCMSPLSRARPFGSFAFSWIVATIAGPLLVASLVGQVPTALSTFLSSKFMTYFGARSYALYLWHYVWLTWLRDEGMLGVAVAFIATLACAELSWRLVESRALALKERLWPRSGEIQPLPRDRMPLLSATR